MDFPNADVRQRVKDVVSRFLWQFVERPEHDAPKADSSPLPRDWAPLPHTPIVVLSSLAPGADWLLVEVADELEQRYQQLPAARRKRPWGFKVVAPLSFPPALYERASTFAGKRGTDHDKQAGKERMRQLAAEGRAFFVPLKQDFELCANSPAAANPNSTQAEVRAEQQKCLEARLNDDLTQPARYHLRYRAAGEYIAAHSHLMLVLNDQTPAGETSPDEVTVPLVDELTGNEFKYGSELVLQLKRQGITPDLLRSEVAFSWADAGPVIHVYTPRQADESAGKLTVLYPVDSRPTEGDLSNDDPNWQWEAGVQFGTVLTQLEAFNKRVVAHAAETRESEEKELNRMVALPSGAATGEKGPEVAACAAGLDRLARARRRAANLADRRYAERWKQLLLQLFLLTLAAAWLLHLAVHWHIEAAHPAPHHPGDPLPPWTVGQWVQAVVQAVLVGTALALIAWAYNIFLRYKASGQEEFRFDYRAVAEGLRVQVYWAAAGLVQSVPANYLQRQRNEMVWIRRAITAMAAPYTRWADGFAALTERDQLTVLKSVIARWVRGDDISAWVGEDDREIESDPDPVQRAKRRADKAKMVETARWDAQAGYIERAGYEDHRAEQFWKRFGIDMTLIGVFNVVVWVVSLFIPDLLSLRTFPIWLWVVALTALVGFVALWVVGWQLAARQRSPAGHRHGFPQASRWRRKDTFWGAWWGGFVWAQEVVYAHAWVWEERKWGRKFDPARRGKMYEVLRWVNVVVVVLLGSAVFSLACAVAGGITPWLPDAVGWWTIGFGSLLIAGALAFTWPERNLLAEHARQYEAMWGVFQAAGRRLLGHLHAAESELAKNNLVLFRARVKAIQDLLYQVGLQALDENAEWLILHRARPLEPLMAG